MRGSGACMYFDLVAQWTIVTQDSHTCVALAAAMLCFACARVCRAGNVCLLGASRGEVVATGGM